MRMSRRLPRILRTWLGLGIANVAIIAAFLVGWLIVEPTVTKSREIGPLLGLSAVFCVVYGLVMLVFIKHLNTVSSPPKVYQEASAEGLPAQAKVEEIEQTHWRLSRGDNFWFRVRPRYYEYVIRVSVQLPETPPYPAETTAFLTASQVPKIGDVVQVKVHPQQPEIVVMDSPNSTTLP
ncbi:MAG: hypothetical protein OHK0023_15050 [Anaerolineae bacterium]